MRKSLTEFDSSKIEAPQFLVGGGGKPSCGCGDPKKQKGNNGFGNGGDDPAPGNSGHNGSPNAGEKLEDRVR